MTVTYQSYVLKVRTFSRFFFLLNNKNASPTMSITTRRSPEVISLIIYTSFVGGNETGQQNTVKSHFKGVVETFFFFRWQCTHCSPITSSLARRLMKAKCDNKDVLLYLILHCFFWTLLILNNTMLVLKVWNIGRLQTNNLHSSLFSVCFYFLSLLMPALTNTNTPSQQLFGLPVTSWATTHTCQVTVKDQHVLSLYNTGLKPNENSPVR